MVGAASLVPGYAHAADVSTEALPMEFERLQRHVRVAVRLC